MFNYIGVGERAGSGVPNIYDIWEKENYQEPTVEELSGREGTICTVVTLPLMEKDHAKDHALSGKGHEKGRDSKSNEIRNREEAIIKLLTDWPEMSISLMSKELQLSEKQIRTAIDNLKESGRIRREGSARNGKWIID